jgi:hypothetical protein
MADLPSVGTQEYLWWSQGAADEAKARDERMSSFGREVRDVLEALADMNRPMDGHTPEWLVTELARIYCPERLRRKYRD